LLYKQTLPGRYIRFTKRNHRVLDSTLHRLVRGQLLTAQLKTDDLPEDPLVRKRSNQETAITNDAEPPMDTNRQLIVNLSLSSKGQLTIEATNPQQVPIHILLQQEDRLYIHKEQFNQPCYSRLMNIVRIPDEWFYVIIKEPLQELTYRITAPTALTPYRLELIQTRKRHKVRSAASLKPSNPPRPTPKAMANHSIGLF
jgi:hypothetical protein